MYHARTTATAFQTRCVLNKGVAQTLRLVEYVTQLAHTDLVNFL